MRQRARGLASVEDPTDRAGEAGDHVAGVENTFLDERDRSRPGSVRRHGLRLRIDAPHESNAA